MLGRLCACLPSGVPQSNAQVTCSNTEPLVCRCEKQRSMQSTLNSKCTWFSMRHCRAYQHLHAPTSLYASPSSPGAL